VTRQQNETEINLQNFVVVPPTHYAIVVNPVVRDAHGEVKRDEHGSIVLHFGREEVRCGAEIAPFALYPGEVLRTVAALPQVAQNAALLLKAQWELKDLTGKVRRAGERWLFVGPATYTPLSGIDVLEERNAIIIQKNQALRVAAIYDGIDHTGKARVAGEQWLVSTLGAYILGAGERVAAVMNAEVLTPTVALEVRASEAFTDARGVQRNIGDHYLITMKDTEAFLPDVRETVVARVPLVTLTKQQYCVVENVYQNGKASYGASELRRGGAFFLQPGEKLQGDGVYDVIVLGAEQALSIRAVLAFKDTQCHPPRDRRAGERWTVYGPCEYVPQLESRVEQFLRARVQLDSLNVNLLYTAVPNATHQIATKFMSQAAAVAAAAPAIRSSKR
jgi:major vault protein